MLNRLFLASALLLAGYIPAAGQNQETSPSQIKVIAHRGYWTAPESAQNSLASFAKADAIGVYGSEFDVWMTSDDDLVVNHDRIYAGTNIDMEKSPREEIASIALANGEKIPTLDQYFEQAARMPGTRLVLEMKVHYTPEREVEAVKKIVEKLRHYGLVERTDIISFSLHACQRFHEELPDTRIYYLAGNLSPQQLKDYGLAGLDYYMGVLRDHPQWIEQAHALGLEVNVWTVNSEQDMQEFIDRGVDYITTDYPERLQVLLKK